MASKYVSHAGDDGAAGSSLAPYRTIQKAIDNIGANETAYIINDGDYVLETLHTAADGVITDGTQFTSASQNFTDSVIGKNLFLRGLYGDDGYGYKIIARNGQTLTLSRTAPNGSGRTYYIGDQDAISIMMDNPAGNAQSNTWIRLAGENSSDRPLIRTSGGAANDLAIIRIAGQAQTVESLLIQGTAGSSQIAVLEEDVAVYSGLQVRNCHISGIKIGVRSAWQKNVAVLGCIVELGTNQTASNGLYISGEGAALIGNFIRGVLGGNNLSNRGISISGSGGYIFGNIVRDFQGSSFTAGIVLSGSGCSVANNTAYNILTSSATGCGGLVLQKCATAINNIIAGCTYGIKRFSYEIGLADYNCVYNCTTPYDGLSAGLHDLAVNPEFESVQNDNFRARNPLVLRGGISDIAGNPGSIGAIRQMHHFPQRASGFNPARLSIIR